MCVVVCLKIGLQYLYYICFLNCYHNCSPYSSSQAPSRSLKVRRSITGLAYVTLRITGVEKQKLKLLPAYMWPLFRFSKAKKMLNIFIRPGFLFPFCCIHSRQFLTQRKAIFCLSNTLFFKSIPLAAVARSEQIYVIQGQSCLRHILMCRIC